MAATQEATTIVAPGVAAQTRVPALAVPGRFAVECLSRAGARAGLLAVMVVGSVALFTALPAAWLWLGSQLTDSYIYGRVPIYLLLGIAIPVSMALGGKLLCYVGALHERVRGTPARSVPDSWRRSRSDARNSAAPVTALDVISTVTAASAVIALVVYLAVDLLTPFIRAVS